MIAEGNAGAAARAKPRILVAGPLPPPLHGVSVLTAALLGSGLKDRFELVHVDTRDRRGVANIGRLDAGNVWLALRHGIEFLVRLAGKPDLVYLPVSKNALGFLRDALFMAPAALRGVPMVLHFHGSGFDEFVRGSSRVLQRGIRATAGRARIALVLGDALVEMLDGVVPRERIRVVPNGVADPDIQRRPSAPGPLRVLFIGNLRPDKGYIDLLEAGLELMRREVPIELTFVGGVSDERAHEAALRRLQPPLEGVRFTGVLAPHERDDALRMADVLVLPSRDEAHPLVVLEAMAAGLPVVATRHSTLPETVVDGETGILVGIGEPAAIGAALLRLTDPDLRARMGAAGRARYCAQYTLERWTQRMNDVFIEAMGDKAGARS